MGCAAYAAQLNVHNEEKSMDNFNLSAISSELADMAHFLASPSGRSITGQTIIVDGGDSLRYTNLDDYHLDQD